MINGRKTIADSFDGCIPDDSQAYDVPTRSQFNTIELEKKIKRLEKALELACTRLDEEFWKDDDFENPSEYWIGLAKAELEKE